MRKAVVFILALVAVRLVVASLYPLLPDEAYYWVWSTQLSWGYFDHPPGIALIIRLGTLIFGAWELGVRLVPVLLSGSAGLFVFLLVEELSDERKAFHGLLAGTSCFILGIPAMLAVPDVPLLFFWALGLLAGIKALRKPWWWLLFGLALGGALVSKYPGIFLLSLPIAYLFTRPKALARWHFLAGMALALAMVFPNLLWNAHHGWVSLGYQAGHGLGHPFNPAGALKYIGDALLVNNPFLFPFLLWGLWRVIRAGTPRGLALGLSFLVPFGFFWVASLFGRPEANWPAPAYLSLTAVGVLGIRSLRNKAWLFSLGLGLVLTGLVYAHAIRPFLPLRGDPTARARGWKELALCVQNARELYPGLGLASPRYQESSELTFYLPDHPRVVVADPRGRPNQLSMLYPDSLLQGRNFLFVGEPPRRAFGSVEKIMKCSGPRAYNIYLVKGYLCR